MTGDRRVVDTVSGHREKHLLATGTAVVVIAHDIDVKNVQKKIKNVKKRKNVIKIKNVG